MPEESPEENLKMLGGSKQNPSVLNFSDGRVEKSSSAKSAAVPFLTASEVSQVAHHSFFSKLGLSGRGRTHKKDHSKLERSKRKRSGLGNDKELRTNSCDHRAVHNLQPLDDSQVIFLQSVEVASTNSFSPLLAPERSVGSPDASTLSQQRRGPRNSIQSSSTKRHDVVGVLIEGYSYTPTKGLGENNSTASRCWRHRMDEKASVMGFDSNHRDYHGKNSRENSPRLAVGSRLTPYQQDFSNNVSANSSFSTTNLLQVETSQRSVGRDGGMHTSFAQLGLGLSTTEPLASQTLRDAKSVLRKHAPVGIASAASSTHVAINSVVGLSLHSFHPMNSCHSRSSCFRNRRAHVRRGVGVSDLEDSNQDRELSTVGVTNMISVSSSAEVSFHRTISQMLHRGHSARAHESLADKSFRCSFHGPLDVSCTPRSCTVSEVDGSTSEQQSSPLVTASNASRPIAAASQLGSNLEQVGLPQMILEMLDTSRITSADTGEAVQDYDVAYDSLSSMPANGMSLRAHMTRSKSMRPHSSRSIQSADASDTSDSEVEAEHQKKVDELLKILATDRKSRRSNSVFLDDPLSGNSNNAGTSKDTLPSGFVGTEYAASFSHNAMNCTTDPIIGGIEASTDSAAASSGEEKAATSGSGWMCIGSLLSSQDWYSRMRCKKDKGETEEHETESAGGQPDKDKEHASDASSRGGSPGNSLKQAPREGTEATPSLQSKALHRSGSDQTTAEARNEEPRTSAKVYQPHECDYQPTEDNVSFHAENRPDAPMRTQNVTAATPRSETLLTLPLARKVSISASSHTTPTSRGVSKRENETLSRSLVSASHTTSILVQHERTAKGLFDFNENNMPEHIITYKVHDASQKSISAHTHGPRRGSVTLVSQSATFKHPSNAADFSCPPRVFFDGGPSDKHDAPSSSNGKKSGSTPKVAKRTQRALVSTPLCKIEPVKKGKASTCATASPGGSDARLGIAAKFQGLMLPKMYCGNEAPHHTCSNDALLPALSHEQLKTSRELTPTTAHARDIGTFVSPKPVPLNMPFLACSNVDATNPQLHPKQSRRETIPHCTGPAGSTSPIVVSLKSSIGSRVSSMASKDDTNTSRGSRTHNTQRTSATATPTVTQPMHDPSFKRKGSLPRVRPAKLQHFRNKTPSGSRRVSGAKPTSAKKSKSRSLSPAAVLPRWNASDVNRIA